MSGPTRASPRLDTTQRFIYPTRRSKLHSQRRDIIDLFIGVRDFRTKPVITLTPIIGGEFLF